MCRGTYWIYDGRSPVCWNWSLPITWGTKKQFIDWISDRCAVCVCEGEAVIDHDHYTGLIRGGLCIRCNNLEPNHDGVFELYRKINPAYILDQHFKYGAASY